MSVPSTSSGSESACVAGAARVDITPPLEVGLLLSSVEERWGPFEGIHAPLMARALFIRPGGSSGESAGDAVAMVSLDLLGLSGKAVGGWTAFKARIAVAAGGVVRPERVVLACSHTHCGPESLALSDLYKTPAHAAWVEALADGIGRAIAEAAGTARPCRFSYGTIETPGWGIHRRIQTTQGILLSHPPPPEEIVISRSDVVDDSVNVLAVHDREGRLIASIVNATCHPVHEMCIPLASPDFPGAVSATLEAVHTGSVALFMNGAAGNINPTTVSAGPEASQRHGAALAKAADTLLAGNTLKPCGNDISLTRGTAALPSRLRDGQSSGPTVDAEIAAIRIGDVGFVFLPGEPFVETGLAIRGQSRFGMTAVVGYAEDYIGYIPTDAAFRDGGYETTFGRWSYLNVGSEPTFRREAITLLDALHAGIPNRLN